MPPSKSPHIIRIQPPIHDLKKKRLTTSSMLLELCEKSQTSCIMDRSECRPKGIIGHAATHPPSPPQKKKKNIYHICESVYPQHYPPLCPRFLKICSYVMWKYTTFLVQLRLLGC